MRRCEDVKRGEEAASEASPPKAFRPEKNIFRTIVQTEASGIKSAQANVRGILPRTFFLEPGYFLGFDN